MRNFSLHPFIFWGLSVLIFILTALIAFTCWTEYYEVAVNKNIALYHFGGEGPLADFEHYRTAEAYSDKMKIDGLISTLLTLSILGSIIKKSDRGVVITALLSLGFFIYLAT